MTRGQFFTVFTMGFAAAIALLGAACGITVLFWHRPVFLLAYELGSLGDHLPPFYAAVILAGSGLFIAYWLISIQQSITHWLANREIERMNQEYSELASAIGSAKAEEIMRERLMRRVKSAPFGMFDAEPILDALSQQSSRKT